MATRVLVLSRHPDQDLQPYGSRLPTLRIKTSNLKNEDLQPYGSRSPTLRIEISNPTDRDIRPYWSRSPTLLIKISNPTDQCLGKTRRGALSPTPGGPPGTTSSSPSRDSGTSPQLWNSYWLHSANLCRIWIFVKFIFCVFLFPRIKRNWEKNPQIRQKNVFSLVSYARLFLVQVDRWSW